MILRPYQKECLPTRESCGNCKLVEAFYSGEPSLHWFFGYDISRYDIAKFTQCVANFNRDLSSNAIKALPVRVFANLRELRKL